VTKYSFALDEAFYEEEELVELGNVNVKEALDRFENVKALIERKLLKKILCMIIKHLESSLYIFNYF
jgi:hypothetical protein